MINCDSIFYCPYGGRITCEIKPKRSNNKKDYCEYYWKSFNIKRLANKYVNCPIYKKYENLKKWIELK